MSDLSKSLKTAISDVMERMFFLLPDPPDGDPWGGADGLSVSVGITGNPLYRLTLVFDRDLARAMAVNILGISVDPKDYGTTNKCLLEAANVIAGNFLHLWDEGSERNITIPSLDRSRVFDRFTPHETLIYSYSFEGKGIVARMDMAEPE